MNGRAGGAFEDLTWDQYLSKRERRNDKNNFKNDPCCWNKRKLERHWKSTPEVSSFSRVRKNDFRYEKEWDKSGVAWDDRNYVQHISSYSYCLTHNLLDGCNKKGPGDDSPAYSQAPDFSKLQSWALRRMDLAKSSQARTNGFKQRVSADAPITLPSPIRGVSLSSVDRDLSLDRSFRVGQDVFYCDPSGHGDKIPWRIVGVHWDAPPTPYYTIAREDDGGCREKQTSGERLQLCRPLSGSADTCEDVYPEGAKQAKGVRGKDSEFDVGINEAKEAMGGGSRNTASVGVYEDEIEEEEAIKNATHAQEISRYRLRRPSLWMINDYSTDRLMVERYPYDNEEQSEALIDSILDACADITKPPMDSWGLLMVATKTGWRQLTRRPLKWDFMKSQQRSRRRGPSSEEREDFGAPHEEETSDQPLGDY